MIISLIFPDITLLQEIGLLTFLAVLDYTIRMVQESPSPEQSELRDSVDMAQAFTLRVVSRV